MVAEPLDLQEHRGSRYNIPIRDGLVDKKHRKLMGEAIWLYLYLHKSADRRTGIVARYRHDHASRELDCSLRTVKGYLSRLHKAGYITVSEHKTYETVTIAGYLAPFQHMPATDTVQHPAHFEPLTVQDVAHFDPEPTDTVQDVARNEGDSVQHPAHKQTKEVPQPADSVQDSSRGKGRTTRNTTADAVVGGASAQAAATAEGDAGAADDAETLCREVGLEPTPAVVKAMANVVKRLAPRVQAAGLQTLEEMATEARCWLEGPRNRKRDGGMDRQPSVPFFRNWVQRELDGAGERREARAHGDPVPLRPYQQQQTRGEMAPPAGWSRPRRELTAREQEEYERLWATTLADPVVRQAYIEVGLLHA